MMRLLDTRDAWLVERAGRYRLDLTRKNGLTPADGGYRTFSVSR